VFVPGFAHIRCRNRQMHRQMVSVFGRERVLSGVFGLFGPGVDGVARDPPLTALGTAGVLDRPPSQRSTPTIKRSEGRPSGTFDPMDAGVVRRHPRRSAVAARTSPPVPHVRASKAHLPS